MVVVVKDVSYFCVSSVVFLVVFVFSFYLDWHNFFLFFFSWSFSLFSFHHLPLLFALPSSFVHLLFHHLFSSNFFSLIFSLYPTPLLFCCLSFSSLCTLLFSSSFPFLLLSPPLYPVH